MLDSARTYSGYSGPRGGIAAYATVKIPVLVVIGRQWSLMGGCSVWCSIVRMAACLDCAKRNSPPIEEDRCRAV